MNSYKDNSNNENALEKAQQMLNKYSNKTFGSVSAKPVVARKFDEDDLSLDSEEDGNEKNVGFNESEESDSFNDTTLSVILINKSTTTTYYLYCYHYYCYCNNNICLPNNYRHKRI